MVGFPGETEKCFLETVDFVRKARFLDAHVFAYSEREGTDAVSLPNSVPKKERQRRSRELIRVVKEVRDEILDGIVGEERILSCILETEKNGQFTAHSDEFIEVSVFAPENRQGDIVKVLPVSHNNGVILGKLIK